MKYFFNLLFEHNNQVLCLCGVNSEIFKSKTNLSETIHRWYISRKSKLALMVSEFQNKGFIYETDRGDKQLIRVETESGDSNHSNTVNANILSYDEKSVITSSFVLHFLFEKRMKKAPFKVKIDK